MKIIEKEEYQSPKCCVIELIEEGVIAESPSSQLEDLDDADKEVDGDEDYGSYFQ